MVVRRVKRPSETCPFPVICWWASYRGKQQRLSAATKALSERPIKPFFFTIGTTVDQICARICFIKDMRIMDVNADFLRHS
mmetsp:Transcript_30780/g.70915  ORF Transcript_30780/g.70915 Transcript_30780/m.70915 type:complete len:81 (-) Transcript_30780:477-719(-)